MEEPDALIELRADLASARADLERARYSVGTSPGHVQRRQERAATARRWIERLERLIREEEALLGLAEALPA